MRCHDRAERGITGHGVPSIPAAQERVSRAIRPTYARWRSMACRNGADLTALAEPGPAACFLQDELHHGVAYSRELLSGAGVIDDVGVAAFGEGEPGGHLAGPCRHL